jgi:hypothetical protein
MGSDRIMDEEGSVKEVMVAVVLVIWRLFYRVSHKKLSWDGSDQVRLL